MWPSLSRLFDTVKVQATELQATVAAKPFYGDAARGSLGRLRAAVHEAVAHTNAHLDEEEACVAY